MRKITVEEFKSDKKNIEALKGYLSTKQGMAFLAACEGFHPLRQLASTKITEMAGLHATASAQSDGQSSGGRAENLLGKAVGYEYLLNLIDDLQIPAKAKQVKQSTKAGAAPKAAPLPPTT